MRIERANLDTCGVAGDLVIVIDVIRAFTTAAYAFAAGARDILPVGTVEEARALLERFPEALLMGEVGGWPIEGFDYGNSPTGLVGHNLSGRRIVQRTGAGTQEIVRSVRADTLHVSSFVCAEATARYIMRQAPASVTLVVTGVQGGRDGDEDTACADYLEMLLRGSTPNREPFLQRVRASTSGQLFTDPAHPAFPSADLDCCTDVDRFDFVMLVERRDGLLIMEAVR